MEVPLVHDRGFEFVNPRLVMSNSGKSITLSESGDYMRMPCLGFMNVLARPHIVEPGQNVMKAQTRHTHVITCLG